jgi:hypothetical protein
VNGIFLSILTTLGLTIVVSLVEIRTISKSSFKACVTGWFFLYFALLLVGNIAAAVFASYSFVSKIPVSLQNLSPYLDGFLGVFAFSAVISRMNVTLFDKGVLTIDEWIGKSRDNAGAASIAAEARIEQDHVERNAKALDGLLTSTELETYVQKYCGQATVDAAKKAANPELYMRLELAGRPEAASIIKERKK